MKLFVLRHGAAGQRNLQKFPNDAARPLTARGKRETRRTAQTLYAEKILFDEIVSSPLVRARQTAEIVAAQYRKEVKLTPHLAPEGDMRELLNFLHRSFKNAESILVVGHEPYLTTLIAVLISGNEGVNLRLKKGGLCKLSLGALRFGKCARLDWLLTPRQLGA
jgi:phosphohistidine phosphatase